MGKTIFVDLARYVVMQVLCPYCLSINQVVQRNFFVRAEVSCHECGHVWQERPQALKFHKDKRLARLEKLHQKLLARRYQKIDAQFNEKKISAQQYSQNIKEMEKDFEHRSSAINAALNKFWNKHI